MENDLLKRKSSGISAILGNNKLSKEIADALNSPFGSTKRKKASSILRAVNPIVNDGMGGGLEENALYSQGAGAPLPMSTMDTPTPSATIPKQTPTPTPGPTAPGGIDLGLNPDTSTSMSTPEMYGGSTQIFPSAPKLKTGGAMPSFTDDGGTNQDGTSNITLPQTQDEVASFLDNVDEDYVKRWYEGLSEEEQKRWKPLYEAADAGVGAKTFAWNIMQDTDALKQLFPNIPTEALPQGASLVGQLKDIETTLKEEFEIDKLKGNMDNLINEGMTIEDNLTDYITARDTYIERLDEMIGTAKEQMVDMDMANPYVAKKMNGYMNYLYIMKGRQQKTYTDFLNSGINQYNQQVAVASDLYENAYSKFSDSLKNKTAVTKEEHDVMTNMLEDMYNNVEGRERSRLSMENLRQEVIQNQYETAYDVLDSLNGNDNTTFTTKDKTTSQKNFLAANPTKKLTDWTALSGEEKLSYIDAEDAGDNEAVDSYVSDIMSSVFLDVPTIYYNSDKETIMWNSIPADKRDAARKMYEAKYKELTELADQADNATNKEEEDAIQVRIDNIFGL